MSVHTIRSKAIRFNGFTDGIIVPTGQYKESGVNLLRPAYAQTTATTKSHATKIGRIHYPRESNPLNNITGPFTIEAFIVPNYGGTVVSKPNCFELKVGDPFKEAPIEFSIHCIGRVFTVATSFNINVLVESHSGTYAGGEHKPNDLSEGAQPLMMVCAQFTGDEMHLYVNGNLVASLNLVKSRILDNVSSDLFIGGRGGEYRGLIESVRISNGIVEPVVESLMVQDQTIGLWDFNDRVEVPNIRFFNNRNEVSASQGRDSADYTDRLDVPLVMLGYDFQNINDYGYFKVYDRPDHSSGNDDTYTALERLAAYITGLELKDIKKQTWHSSTLNVNASSYGSTTGSLDYLASDRIKQSSLNAVINQSGTHPMTGMTMTASGRLVDLTSGNTVATGVESDLDPMTNPIERVRIISLDFANDRVVCQSVHLQNDATSSATVENHPKGQGLLFDHADGTPVWLTLGNADLTLDPGDLNIPDAFVGVPATVDTIVGGSGYTAATGVATTGGSGSGLTVNTTVSAGAITAIAINAAGSGYEVGETITVSGGTGGTFDIATLVSSYTRPKDAFTRATFTQGQRFRDLTANNNVAYFTSIQSRITTGTPASTSINPDPDPPKSDLLVWLNAGGLTGVSDGDTITHVPDQSGNDFSFYTIGTWQYVAASGTFNSKPALRIISSDGALMNIGTDDGESKQLTQTGTSFTAFWFMKPSLSASYTTNLIGQNNSTPKTFFGANEATNAFVLVNNGTTTSNAVSHDVESFALVSATFDATSTNATVHISTTLETTFVAKLTGAINFADSLLTLFGTGASANTSSKTGTSTNNALQDTLLAEFLLYEKAMNDAERTAVQGYFLDKYTVI